MRIVFFGTSSFGEPSLLALAGMHEIAAVVTRCDSCQGRGRKMAPSRIKVAATELGIEVLDPPNLKDSGFVDKLRDLKADLFFVVAFRILPEEVFSIPTKGTVNLHGSLLPDYRGAAPIHHAVMNGDTVTGLTTFFIEKGIDTGDMILQEKVLIGPDETTGELSERMRVAGASLTIKTIELIEKGNMPRLKQQGSGRPAPRLFKEDCLIDWTLDVHTVHNKIRGLSPLPGAFSQTSSGPLKITRTAIIEETSVEKPGLIFDVSPKTGFSVHCGKGSLRVTEIQPPCKNCMESSSFVRGYRLQNGMIITDLL